MLNTNTLITHVGAGYGNLESLKNYVSYSLVSSSKSLLPCIKGTNMYYHRTLASFLAITSRSHRALAFSVTPSHSITADPSFAISVVSSPRHCPLAVSDSHHHHPNNYYSTSTTLLSATLNDNNNNAMSASMTGDEPRKAGVASPSELKDFVTSAGSRILIVDVRHPDANIEPGDVKSLAVAGFPTETYRPRAINLPWSRETKSMELPDATKVSFDTPIITHCGGGGRGQEAKEYLEKHGYTNVINGGGPKETECWAEFGSL